MKNIEAIFAENLKKRRKQFKLTQKALSERMGYSEKAISKWESGKCMPPAAVLPNLARILATDIDSLLCEESDIRYYLGIDGGGTKTEFLLCDSDHNEISHILLGSCNPNDVGFDNTLALLSDGIRQVCGDIPRRTVSVFAGIAGILTGDYMKLTAAFLEKQSFGTSACGSDAKLAVASALGYSDGIAVIMGTGSIAFAQSGNELTRVGGYGYLLGDGGSGYAIARDGICASLADEDGSGEATVIRNLIEKQALFSPLLSNISKFYAGGKKYIASFSPCVFDAYAAGDAVAQRIIDRNMKDIAAIIKGAAKHLSHSEKTRVVLCGGLISQSQVVIPLIEKHLEDHTNKYIIDICEKSMVEGALLLAGLEDKNA